MAGNGKETLYRRLGQARRLAAEAHDSLTAARLQNLISDLEEHLTAIEARDADDPPE